MIKRSNQNSQPMTKQENVYVFIGVDSSHQEVLNNFLCDPGPRYLYKVSASNLSALPPQSEMDKIARKAPCIFFAPGMLKEIPASKQGGSVDIAELMDRSSASIFYVDPGVTLRYRAHSIHVETPKGIALRLDLQGDSLRVVEALR